MYMDDGRRWGAMTTNVSESYNDLLKKAQGLPMTAMVNGGCCRKALAYTWCTCNSCRNNKVVIFDTIDFGRSNLSLPRGRCRYDPNDMVSCEDCYSHSVLYGIGSNTFRALMLQTDPWCSSGAVLPDGTLVQIGGYNDGDRVIHTPAPYTGENCDWVELTRTLIQ
ncbi:hypothetical protein FXO38_21406 [Capsicum annuum]|nr:hypothetical protein FXO38_21406 [Capsicum annuum]KAF3642216.1 hypothetical protein FXO37_22615 [Capsicum annuum]